MVIKPPSPTRGRARFVAGIVASALWLVVSIGTTAAAAASVPRSHDEEDDIDRRKVMYDMPSVNHTANRRNPIYAPCGDGGQGIGCPLEGALAAKSAASTTASSSKVTASSETSLSNVVEGPNAVPCTHDAAMKGYKSISTLHEDMRNLQQHQQQLQSELDGTFTF